MKYLYLFIAAALLFATPNYGQIGKLRGKLKEGEPKMDVSKMMMGGGDVELEDSYQYDFAITYLAENEDLEEPTEIKQFFSEGNDYMGMAFRAEEGQMKGNEMVSVIDLERSYFIILNQDDKQAMVMGFDPVEEQVAEQEGSPYEIVKTGATKTIAGYSCEQYKFSGEGGSGEMWVTQEIDYEDFDLFSYLKRLQQQQDGENSIFPTDMKGFMMQVTGVDEDGKSYNLIATEVDENADVSFDMSEFEVMDLTGFQKMQKMQDRN